MTRHLKKYISPWHIWRSNCTADISILKYISCDPVRPKQEYFFSISDLSVECQILKKTTRFSALDKCSPSNVLRLLFLFYRHGLHLLTNYHINWQTTGEYAPNNRCVMNRDYPPLRIAQLTRRFAGFCHPLSLWHLVAQNVNSCYKQTIWYKILSNVVPLAAFASILQGYMQAQRRSWLENLFELYGMPIIQCHSPYNMYMCVGEGVPEQNVPRSYPGF